MPYCFPRSSIKFQGHAGQNITNFDPNWAFPDYRPLEHLKSLRFALFGFQTLNLVWLWISTPNLSGTIVMYMCRSLLIFSNVNFKIAARRPYCFFFCFRTLTLLWLWISTPNLSGTILIYMGRSLLTFSDITFKMAAWWPYWIFWFSD